MTLRTKRGWRVRRRKNASRQQFGRSKHRKGHDEYGMPYKHPKLRGRP